MSVEPKGIFTVSLILPEPLAEHVAEPVAEQVQLALAIFAEKLSVTVAPLTSLGPLFETTIVYVVVPPLA